MHRTLALVLRTQITDQNIGKAAHHIRSQCGRHGLLESLVFLRLPHILAKQPCAILETAAAPVFTRHFKFGEGHQDASPEVCEAWEWF